MLVMIVGTIWNLIAPWSDQVWSRFWWWAAVALPLSIGVITTLWFTWGVMKDLRSFFAALDTEQVDDGDDGTVRE